MSDQEKAVGFARLSAEERKEIARKGGERAHAVGRANAFTSNEARQAGRQGGVKVSSSPGHMARIGRLGGLSRRYGRQKALEMMEALDREGS